MGCWRTLCTCSCWRFGGPSIGAMPPPAPTTTLRTCSRDISIREKGAQWNSCHVPGRFFPPVLLKSATRCSKMQPPVAIFSFFVTEICSLQIVNSNPWFFFIFNLFCTAKKQTNDSFFADFPELYPSQGNISRQETIVRTIAETVGGVAVFK